MNDDIKAIESRWALARAIRAWTEVDSEARKRLIGDLDDQRLQLLGNGEDSGALAAASDVLEALAKDPRSALIDQLVKDIETLLQSGTQR